MIRRVRRAVAAVAVGALVAAGCGLDVPDGPTTGPSTTTRPPATGTGPEPSPATSEPAEPAVPELAWRSCGDDLECADAEVPLDHDDPAGATTTLAVVRAPARHEDERQGALFVNPGGPGASATDLAASLARGLPGDIRDRFDVVGFDPRGVGGSEPLSCTDGVRAMYRSDPTIEDRADRQRMLATSRDFVRSCTGGRTDLLAHAGTVDAARDMDLLRRALGDEQVSYLGYSYGTAIGQVYADLFPERVRAMVLDGVVDLAEPGVEGVRTQAVGFERALGRFAAWCRGEGDSCPIAPDPMAVVDQVIAASERAPIPSSAGDRSAGPGEVTLAVAEALYTTSRWDDLAEALDDAASDDGAGLVDLADRYIGTADFGTYFAVNCLDAEWPDVDGILAEGKAAARVAPHFGEAIVNDFVRCSLWPVAPDPVAPPSRGADLAPVLVVSTVGDPATPYESGVAVADHLDHGVLLTYEGDGHTITFDGNGCIDDAVERYLVELEPPDDGARCSP